jgi:hypothetical protein
MSGPIFTPQHAYRIMYGELWYPPPQQSNESKENYKDRADRIANQGVSLRWIFETNPLMHAILSQTGWSGLSIPLAGGSIPDKPETKKIGSGNGAEGVYDYSRRRELLKNLVGTFDSEKKNIANMRFNDNT